MKAFFPYFAFAAIQLIAANIAGAQSTSSSTLKAPPQNIAIDGSIKDWGDSLCYSNAEKHLNYALANDKDNLYMAIRVDDRSEQIRILKAGFTLSINPKGKKKNAYSITFPLSTGGGGAELNLPKDNSDVTTEQNNALKAAVLTFLRGIKVEGFKDIEDDMITTSNTYGIKTAVNYDEKGELICEAAIPLKLFHADDAVKNEWAFNFKINGVTRPSAPEGDSQEITGGGGRGGRGGGGRGGRGGRAGGGRGGNFGSEAGRGVIFTSEDFWDKYFLAK